MNDAKRGARKDVGHQTWGLRELGLVYGPSPFFSGKKMLLFLHVGEFTLNSYVHQRLEHLQFNKQPKDHKDLDLFSFNKLLQKVYDPHSHLVLFHEHVYMF